MAIEMRFLASLGMTALAHCVKSEKLRQKIQGALVVQELQIAQYVLLDLFGVGFRV